ncbi:hypothetical protein [Trichlorobacter sp.]|uniref:hypothetical protein n=1 Tax=Trichlorobacter sp. TaxID=2911007 RepID=UPI002A36E93F|nr:hypothetical protein [Trichlorobacter sp.]MDY0384734.1 hypothetical protein [Trichlorobacter sp.]
MNNSDVAACTIVSMNYYSYARTLYASFNQHNPGAMFFVLLVDKKPVDVEFSSEPFEVIEISDLAIDSFAQMAFQFDIVELNTNVKPAFMEFILKERNISKLIYLDPDILVYRSMEHLIELLDSYEIILTPHCNSRIDDNLRPSEQDFLQNGVFNLGFIAVSNGNEAFKFLDWWGNRCLMLGFSETRTGLFVDQKWVNFAPCFFDRVLILKHPGYNMAYWNLHERILDQQEEHWTVNGYPLVFYHFSGIDVYNQQQISKHQNRYDLQIRPDLKQIFDEYRTLLLNNGYEDYRTCAYGYGTFSNGKRITHVARRLYAANKDSLGNADPFSSDGEVYAWCNRNGFFSKEDQSGVYNALTYDKNDYRVRAINYCLKLLLGIFGANRYTLLMKYLSYISVLRNQKNIFPVK